MVSIVYYRAEAERCRKLADESKDPEAARRWRAVARDYNALADEFERASSLGPPPVMTVPVQQQPVQQQQSKKSDGEDDA